MNITAESKRAEATRHEQEREASFARSDTDGFLSQWSSGIMAAKARMEADLIEAGGVHDFPALFTLDGTWVPAKVITTRFGSRWMVLDANGRRTGEYLTYHPKRRDTLAKHGYVEGYVTRPAKVENRGSNIINVHPAVVEADRPHDKPIAIVTTDRWS